MRKSVYWVLGDTRNRSAKYNGMIVGCYSTEEEAIRDAELKFGVDNYRVFLLSTIDKREARSRIQRQIFDETNSIDEAFKRFTYKKRQQEVY